MGGDKVVGPVQPAGGSWQVAAGDKSSPTKHNACNKKHYCTYKGSTTKKNIVLSKGGGRGDTFSLYKI